MKARALLLTLLCPALAHAGGYLVSGHLQSLHMLHSGAPGCPSLNGAEPDGKGGTRVHVSNDCGCETIRFHVDETIAGQAPAAELELSSRIGEWCRAAVPAWFGPMLLHATDKGSFSGAVLETRGDGQYFSAQAVPFIFNIQTSRLADAQHMVALSAVRLQLEQDSKEK
jgi:hypothetical protein